MRGTTEINKAFYHAWNNLLNWLGEYAKARQGVAFER